MFELTSVPVLSDVPYVISLSSIVVLTANGSL
jgi:hypothetical protein